MPQPLENRSAKLPDAAHVGRVALQVADLGRSLAFYEGVLGFRVLARESSDTRASAILAAADNHVPLVELREKRGVRPVPPRGLIGLYHFAILLPSRGDLGRFITHAVNSGVSMGAADHGVSEALYLTDPDGLQVEVYRDLPRADWPVADGAIAMTTLPLDFDPIVESAGQSQWSGLPAGTTIGHVHHYVGDIAAARTFYVDGLGFAPTFTRLGGALFVAAGGYHHHVGLNIWAASSPIATPDDARLLYWQLVLPDGEAVDAAVSRLRALHVPVRSLGPVYEATDPWGIVVRIDREETH